MKSKLFCISVFLGLLFSCNNNNKTASPGLIGYDTLQYSESFGIAKFENHDQLFYCNQNDTIWSIRSDEKLKSKPKIVVLSSVFAGFLEGINMQTCIIGVDKINYYSDSIILQRFRDKTITEVGEEGQLKLETLLALKADFVIASSYTYNDKALVKRLQASGTKVLFCDNFKEQNPLARAEWIKFFGFITDQKNKADSVFNVVAKNYNQIKDENASRATKPLVLTDALYQDAWNVPGGNSYTAQLIHDAGGLYVFADKKEFYTFPLNLETVLSSASKADVWIHVNQFKSRQQMLESEKRYRLFNAFQNKMVFNYNKKENLSGGNDFWETGVIRPDLVLLDLTKIMSMDKNNYSNLYFYTWLD
jgi:iron complex transport system substrate-binding protein